MITYRKSQGLLVVSESEGAIVGRLDDFQFALDSRKIFGYRIKGTGMFSKAGGIESSMLTRVGKEVGFLRSELDVEWSSAGRAQEEGRAWASQYKGTRCMSRSGGLLGTVEDFIFDPGKSRVLAFILDGNRLLPIDGNVSIGPTAIVADGEHQLTELPNDTRQLDETWRRLLAAS